MQKKIFWKNVKKILKEKKIKEKEFSVRIGKKPNAIALYVNKNNTPKIDLAIAIARGLGVTVEELWGD